MRKWWVLPSLCLAAAGLVYCGGPSPFSSNLAISNGDAQSQVDLRLKKTQEIKAHLGNVHSALNALDSVLSDVAHAVDSRVQGADTGHRLRQLFDRLRGALSDASRGLVSQEPDGSYKMSRELPLPMGRAPYDCPAGTLEVTDRKDDDKGTEKIKLTLSDCYSGGPVTLAEIRVHADGEVVASFAPDSLDRLLPPDPNGARSPECNASSRQGEQYVHCDPFVLRSGDASLTFRGFDMGQTPAGITALVDLEASDGHGAFELTVTAKPGTDTRIVYRDK
jgi:hypothetical protein